MKDCVCGKRWLVAACLLLLLVCNGLAGGPCQVVPTLELRSNGVYGLTLAYKVAEGVHLAASSMALRLPKGVAAVPEEMAKGRLLEGEAVLEGAFRNRYWLDGKVTLPLVLTVEFQACSDVMCYAPQQLEFRLDGVSAEATEAPPEKTSAPAIASLFPAGYRELGRLAGYRGEADFLAWCDEAEAGREPGENLLRRVFSRYGLWMALLLLLPLGALLNFTPCVLPMIPINLAVIGAAGDGGRRLGLLRGGCYGLGMALAYGGLGAAVVVGGGQFGSLNGTPWFNWGVAAVFLALALSMLGLFDLDFTRWRRGGAATGALGAFALGGVTALLAGACVAPVLLWVLLLAVERFAAGDGIALAMPFALGLGMGLPWAVLGAGLGHLPRPGKWMLRVRQAFGCLILLFALYYAVLGFRLCGRGAAGTLPAGWHGDLENLPSDSNALVFVEVTGKACKACALMERTTLRAPAVVKRMAAWHKLRLDASEGAVREDGEGGKRQDSFSKNMAELEIVGVPTYILYKRCAPR